MAVQLKDFQAFQLNEVGCYYVGEKAEVCSSGCLGATGLTLNLQEVKGNIVSSLTIFSEPRNSDKISYVVLWENHFGQNLGYLPSRTTFWEVSLLCKLGLPKTLVVIVFK